MGMRAPVTMNGFHGQKDVDWKELKRQIVAALGPDGVFREFQELGCRMVNGFNAKGKAVCHAMDRPDETPSAFVNVNTGIYHSKGVHVETLNLFDFALKYGSSRFPDWLGTIKYFAETAGVPLDARKDGKGRILEATYDYTDEAGELLYQVLRYRHPSGKKDFRQRRPDGRDGWIYDLEGVRRVLYQLPEIAFGQNRSVIIVEGEKDSDRLNEMFERDGLPAIATTSAQGANDTGRWESYAELLRDRHCVVIPDCDPPGIRHARGVCGFLHGVAASVKLVELPGVGPKGDISDWLDQDNPIDDLWMLIAAAPMWEPSAIDAETDADANRDATAADLIRANAGTKWLWPQWIPLGVLTLLTAEPSTGKTRLGLDLTRRIALGLEWPDGQPMELGDRRPVVLWVPADSQHSELADAPKLFGFPPEAIILNTSIGDLYGGTELQTPEQLEDFEERINRQQPALVIIDTITNTSDAKSQDTADAKRQYKPLQEIAKRTGAGMICVTHTNIAGKTLGRRADEKTRVTIRMEKPDPDNQPHRRKLSVALTRISVMPPPLGVTMGDSGNTYDGNPPEAPPDNGYHSSSLKLPSAVTQDAIGYLAAALRLGPVRVADLRTNAERREPPIAAKQLYEARKYLPIEEIEIEDEKRRKYYKYWKLIENAGQDETPF